MENVNIFEIASRKKLRFEGYRGNISVEELWDVPKQGLDQIYKLLKKKKDLISEDSLFDDRSPEDDTLNLQIAIIKHIASVKKEEQDLKEKSILKKQEKEKIMTILAEKNDAALRDKTPEELQAMLNKIDSI